MGRNGFDPRCPTATKTLLAMIKILIGTMFLLAFVGVSALLIAWVLFLFSDELPEKR